MLLDIAGEWVYEGDMSLIPETTMLILSGAAGLFNPIDTTSESADRVLRIGYANDESFNHDRDYTQGARVDYCAPMGRGTHWGVSLAQNIYTPATHTRHAVPGEHPYAGTLALGGALMKVRENYGMCVEFQLGTTGDPSLARHCQNGVHNMIGSETWDGWNDQVPSEVTFQLTAAPAFDLPFLSTDLGNGWGTDGLVFGRGELGTVRMAGGAGLGFRIGKNLPDGMQIVGSRPGTYGLGPIKRTGYKVNEISYFLVANVYGEYVGRDIAIDGGVFHHFDRTCGRTPWQVEGAVGVGVSYHHIDYFAGARLHSSSYRTQDKNSAMGVFSIGWKW